MSIKYGLSGQKYQELMYTIEHESSWDVSAYNKGDEKYVKGGSKGILEYTIPTWNGNCLEFAKTRDESPIAQIKCSAKMFSKGQEYNWSTWCHKYGLGLKSCDWANKKPAAIK